MIVELNSSFYNLPFFNQLQQHDMIHKTYKQIKGTQEEQFFKEFVNQVLIDEPVWGRNKYSYDASKINNEPKIFNFDFFSTYQFHHYHLTDFNCLNDPNYENWTPVSIHNPNNNCCPQNGFLVHYQLLLDEKKIVIHSISKHGPNNPWKALFDLISPNSYGYDLCLSCNKKYPSTYTSCAYGCINHKKNCCMFLKETIAIQDSLFIMEETELNNIRLDLTNTQYIFNSNTYNNFLGTNIVINNITDLYYYLK